VVLIHGLSILHAAKEAWGVVLRETEQRLGDEEAVSDQAEDSVRRLEVCPAVRNLVVFDDDQAGDEAEDAAYVEGGMDDCALAFLGRSMGWLEDEDGFGCEE